MWLEVFITDPRIVGSLTTLHITDLFLCIKTDQRQSLFIEYQVFILFFLYLYRLPEVFIKPTRKSFTKICL